MTVKEKLAFGYGDLGLSISWTIIGFYFLFYLTDVAQVNAAWAGFAILIGKIWDAFSDPLFGAFSDKTTSRLGRRRPYILGAAIPYGITFIILWTIPHWSPWLKIFYSTIAFLFHTTASTAYAVPYNSLTPELAETYDERTSLNAYRMFFSILGGLIAGAVPAFIIQGFENIRLGYSVMGTIFGIVVISSPLMVFSIIREKTVQPKTREGFDKGALKDIVKNKPFLLAVSMYFFTWTGINVVSATIIYFATYVMEREAEIGFLIGILFVSSIVFLPLWVWIAGRLEKRRAYQLGMIELVLCLLFIAFFGDKLTNFWLYFAIVVTGFGVSAAHVLPFSILPDAVEYDRLITGKRREGMYYGLTTFFQKLGTSLMLFVVGLTLNAVGYKPGVPQEPQVLLTIRLLFGGLPGLLFITGILLMMPYPIDRAFQRKMLEDGGSLE